MNWDWYSNNQEFMALKTTSILLDAICLLAVLSLSEAATSDVDVYIRGIQWAQDIRVSYSYSYDAGFPFSWTLTCSDSTSVTSYAGLYKMNVTVAPCSTCTLDHAGYSASLAATWHAFNQTVVLATGSYLFEVPCLDRPLPPSSPPPSPPPLSPPPPLQPGQRCAARYLYPGNHMHNQVSEVSAPQSTNRPMQPVAFVPLALRLQLRPCVGRLSVCLPCGASERYLCGCG